MSSLLSPDSDLYQAFQPMINERKLIFLAGLPGVGKSLLLKQLGLMAQEAGRVVDLLQWDVTRAAFETADILRQYPEIDGVTHAAIRKAVGTWARTAVYEWHQAHRDDEHCLLGEVPLIGNRLMELAQPQVDAAEALLRSEQTLFVVPVPSTAVRQIIEEARARSIAAPQHEKETRDAPPNVLHGLWHDLARLSYELALTKTKPVAEAAYEPEVYAAVYQHLLQHRHYQILPINNVLKPTSSAYDWQPNGTELTATETAVAQTMRHIEQQYSPDTLEQIVSRWFEL